MHAVQLSELAIIFARHAAAQLATGCVPLREQANSYWLASRFRHEEWSGRLAQHRIAIQRPGASHRAQCWDAILPTMQEVLLSGPLTRFLAYYARLLEQVAPDTVGEFSSLADTTFQSQMEARNRCLHLIVFGQGLPVTHSTSLNRLRVHMEKLCDGLLASLPHHTERSKYCFDPLETLDLHYVMRQGKLPSVPLRLYTAGLHQQLCQSTRKLLDKRVSSPRLNGRIGQAVLQMLGRQMFDSFGVPISHEFARLSQVGSERDGKQVEAGRPLDEPLDVLATTQSPRLQQLQRRW